MMHHDSIQEMLLRLPLKSLVRCTCLSQKWHAFISYDKYFRCNYISRNSGYDQLLKGIFLTKRVAYRREEPVKFLPTSSDGKILSVLKKRRRYDTYVTDDVAFPIDASLGFLGHDIVHVKGSSNGFLLTTIERDWPMTYMICNPLNKQHIALPKPNLTSRLVAHGFTCNAALTHYKVVRALCFKALHHTTTLTLEIFSSDLPQWRPFNLTCSIPFFLNMTLRFSTVISKDVTYLPAFIERQTTICPEQCIIVSDQSKEILQVVKVPPREDDYALCHFFGMSNGFIQYGYFELDQLKIWLLNDEGDSKREWYLKHKVCLKSKVENYFECAKDASKGYINLITFHPTDPQVFFLGCGNKRYQYHVNKSRFELICDFEVQGSDVGYHFFPYTYPLLGPHLFRDD